MSLLPNNIDIANDARRASAQNIEDDAKSKEKTDVQPIIESASIQDWLRNFVIVPENIDDLCPELFQLIIAKYLKSNSWRTLINYRMVNKHWRDNIDEYLATKDSFQYSTVIESGVPAPIMNYYEINAMLNFFPRMRQLVIKHFTVSDHLIAILFRKVPHLKRLNLHGCRSLTWKGLTLLSVRFCDLEFIDISHCELNENSFGILCENLTKLKTMSAVCPGKEVTGQCLRSLGPLIQDLWIGLNHLSDANPALRSLVAGNGKNLLHLGVVIANLHLTDLSIITQNIKQLRSLKLTFNSYHSDNLRSIASIKKLEFLLLAENSFSASESVLTDNSMIPIVKNCTNLRSLALAGTKDNTCRFTRHLISQIPRYCKAMEQIRFLNTHELDDDCFIDLSAITTLRVMHMSSMNRITNNGIRNFAKHSARVRNIRICDCPLITEEIIDVWAEVAERRKGEKIRIFLEGMKVTKNLSDLPSNLVIVVKNKEEKK